LIAEYLYSVYEKLRMLCNITLDKLLLGCLDFRSNTALTCTNASYSTIVLYSIHEEINLSSPSGIIHGHFIALVRHKQAQNVSSEQSKTLWTIFYEILKYFNLANFLLPHSLTDSLTHWLTDSLTHWLTDSLTHSLTHSLARSLARSLTHSLTDAFSQA